MATVNKAELAKLLGKTLPTLDRLIDRYQDFPILSRGSNGRNYEFDPEAVAAFLAEKHRQEAEAHEVRMAELAAVDMPLLAKGGVAPTTGPLTPGQTLQTIKAAREMDALAVSRGTLVEASAMRDALKGFLRDIGVFLENLPVSLVRKHNLPPVVLDALRQSLRAEQRRLHDQLLRDLGARAGQLEMPSVAAE